MNTQGTERQIDFSPLQQTSIARVALSITMMIILGLSGLLAMTFAGWVRNDPARPALAIQMTPGSTLNSGVQPLPTLVASPSPTGSLPPTLGQAKAVLRAQNKLLSNGNVSLPEIALTFDDGPNPYYTPQILAILQHYNLKATFFCVGRLAAAYPALVREEYSAGNIVGNHTWSHPNLALLTSAAIQSQIVRTSDIIEADIGVRPTFFRPPYGSMSVQELTQVYHDGLTSVLWNDEGQDWTRPGVDAIVLRILSFARKGTILLMHDGGGDRSQTVAALPIIIRALEKRGFRFVTLQQMVLHLRQHASSTDGNTPSVGSPPLLLALAWRREPDL